MPNEVVVDQKPMPQLPYDPDSIPPAVRARAAAMEAQFFSKEQAPAEPPKEKPAPAAATPESPSAEPPAEPPGEPQPVSGPGLTLAPAPEPPTAAPPLEDENSGSWKQRYFRMQGQYNAAQKTIGELQEQMSQMGQELYDAQRILSSNSQQRQPAAPPAPPPALLTDQDVQAYGPELIDFTRRAATEAVAPHLQRLEQTNAQLKEQLAREARFRLDQAVEASVPNYREIDANPRWHKWLLGLDLYTGRVRQHLLNEAIARADAPRVVAFFRGFTHDEAATGHAEPAPVFSPQAAAPAPAPREPAVPLASLAAPGRPRPASGGESSVPVEKPLYTRAQIAQLYRQHQRGAYVGREAEWTRQEADMIAAGREGRIR